MNVLVLYLGVLHNFLVRKWLLVPFIWGVPYDCRTRGWFESRVGTEAAALPMEGAVKVSLGSPPGLVHDHPME